MSQLISDTDYINYKKYTYTYDTSGNILTETVSDIDQNGVESNPVTINYSYGDSNWTDKLTAYSGQAITYDAIGNPLAYRDGMTMTWKNGRQLATLQDSNNTISLCPPRKNRQKTQAKNRMKRMTNIIQNCSIRPHLFHGSLDNEPLKV